MGGGRAPGQKNVLKTEVKRSMAEFFTSLTAENYRWRQRVKRVLDGGTTAQEWRAWSLIALDRSLGTPSKHQPEGAPRDSLLFITTHEIQLKLEAAKSEVIEVEPKADEGETLESVSPPDDPRAFGGR